MKKIILLVFLLSVSKAYALKVGDMAPPFSVMASDGKNHALQEFKGQYVVLEWHNKDCPFVKKHYGTGNIQALQKKWTKKNVAWLTVVSSAAGKQGYETASDANAEMKTTHALPTLMLLDPNGKMGKTYEAKTTPHMFVIDKAGKIIYAGAIDDKTTPDTEDVKTAKNYVDAALEEATSGKPVTISSTQPYGCGIKY